MKKEDIQQALKERYTEVWRRVEVLFEVMKKYYQVYPEYEALVRDSAALLREKIF